MSTEQDKRKQAKERLKNQRDFKALVGVFVIIWILLAAVWWFSGGGYFWPVWAYFGMGIALLFVGWNAYGPRSGGISEAAVDREVKRMEE
jgi:uncharacterized membrane protein